METTPQETLANDRERWMAEVASIEAELTPYYFLLKRLEFAEHQLIQVERRLGQLASDSQATVETLRVRPQLTLLHGGGDVS